MDSTGEQVASRLAVEMNSWKSIELTVLDEFRNEISANDPNLYSRATYRDHYIETAMGQRLGEFLETPDGKPEKFSIFYFDGSKGADVAYSGGVGSTQVSVLIKKSYKYEGKVPWNFRPFPLRYFFVGHIPLTQALKDAEPLGEEKCLDRTCDRFLFRQFKAGPQPADFVFSLDRQTGIPLKLTTYNDPKGLAEDDPSSSWRALSFDDVEGRHVPLKSEELVYAPRTSTPSSTPAPGAKPKVIFQTLSTVESIHFDRDYPSTIFWPKIEPSAAVIDTISNTSAKPKTFPGSNAADPIRVVQNDPDYHLPWIGGGLGLALVVFGLIAKMRQK